MNQFNYKDIFNNSHVSISRAISLIENSDAIADKFYKDIYEKSNISIRIGITGPPGAGKSTLVDQLITRFLENQKSKTETVKLSKALDTYIKLKGNGKGELFHRTALRNISYTIECFGDVDINSLKSIDAAKYRDFLFKKGLSTSSVK